MSCYKDKLIEYIGKKGKGLAHEGYFMLSFSDKEPTIDYHQITEVLEDAVIMLHWYADGKHNNVIIPMTHIWISESI